MATAGTPLLQVDSLACIRDDRLLFEDLSFELAPGEALVLEGRNGSGKTSLLRILTGIRLPEAGNIFWRGEDIERLGPDYHQHLSYVGHRDGIKPDLTPLENLRVARALGDSNDAIDNDQALARVELRGFEDVPARQLSAGQQRRLALARLLVTRAELWILDEPFTSLDTLGISITESLMQEHIAAGGMLALTSHHEVHLEGDSIKRINLSS